MAPPLLFAVVDHRSGRGRAFGILPADLVRHVFVVGPTGTGKTTLLERLACEQIARGDGLAIIDPHGDLAASVVAHLPRSRARDVVRFDPAVPEHALPLNLLECRSVEERPLVVAGTISVFAKLFVDSWGPRLENTLRHALYAVLEHRGATLLDVLRLLSDEGYRARTVAKLEDEVVRAFFEREFASWPPGFRVEVVSAVQNKLGAAVASPILRSILGRAKSGFSPRKLMDRGGILVANLAKGRIAEDAARFLGAVLTTKLQLAAYSRAELTPTERRPFTLYADEFAGYATQSFAELAAEARKYGLALVLATQALAQLDAIREVVMGNMGTKIALSHNVSLCDTYCNFDGRRSARRHEWPAFHSPIGRTQHLLIASPKHPHPLDSLVAEQRREWHAEAGRDLPEDGDRGIRLGGLDLRQARPRDTRLPREIVQRVSAILSQRARIVGHAAREFRRADRGRTMCRCATPTATLAMTEVRLWFLYTVAGLIKAEITDITGWSASAIDAGLDRWDLRSFGSVAFWQATDGSLLRGVAADLGVQLAPDAVIDRDKVREAIRAWAFAHLAPASPDWDRVDRLKRPAV